jgi:TRAP-type mannitol/chloroaromatic compound transport system permease large subunit
VPGDQVPLAVPHCGHLIAAAVHRLRGQRHRAGVDLMKVYKGCSILMLALVVTTVLLMIFPEIALWLPRTMR